MHITQPGMNMDQDRQMLMVEDNVENQFTPNTIQNVRNQDNLQQESTSGTQSDKALVYDSDGSTKYTKLLEPISEPHQVPQNDSNVISEVSSVEQGRGTVEQHPANVKET
nr:hypothetical protein [Tanacetum cinerariifolium]